jgi:hypothetical protein
MTIGAVLNGVQTQIVQGLCGGIDLVIVGAVRNARGRLSGRCVLVTMRTWGDERSCLSEPLPVQGRLSPGQHPWQPP